MTTIHYKELNDFSSVKVEDVLVVEHGAGTSSRMRTAKVIRITKTQLICNDIYGNEQRYRIKDGKEVAAEGGRFGWVHHSHVRGIKVGDE